MLKFKIFNFSDYFNSCKSAIISRTIAYNHTFELLHQQLYRKKRIKYVELKKALEINNQKYKIISSYDIKSPSKKPYNKKNYHDLGLNQLFVGQNPYKKYRGNPKDGIYHDKCLIIPKNYICLNILSQEYNSLSEKNKKAQLVICEDSWGWILEDFKLIIEDEEFGQNQTKATIRSIKKEDIVIPKNDFFGKDIVATIIKKPLALELKKLPFKDGIYKHPIYCQVNNWEIIYTDGTKKSFTTTPKHGSISFIDGKFYALAHLQLLNFTNLTKLKKVSAFLNIDRLIKKHGEIIYNAKVFLDTSNLSAPYFYANYARELFLHPNLQIKLQAQNLSFEIVDVKSKNHFIVGFKDKTFYTFLVGYIQKDKLMNPTYSFLPTENNSGKLSITKKNFVENWDKYFELFIKENTSVWKKIVSAVVAIVAVILSVWTGGASFGVIGMFGGALVGILGIAGTNMGLKWAKDVSTIGSVALGFGSIYSNLEKEAAKQILKEAGKSVTSASIAEISKTVTFKQIINLLSSSWIKSLTTILQTTSLIGSSVMSLSTKELKEPKEEDKHESEERKKGMLLENGEEIEEPDFIKAVMDVPTLGGQIKNNI